MRVVREPETLTERCKEILEWKRTGLLNGGALRKYATTHFGGIPCDFGQKLTIAEHMTATELMLERVEGQK